MKEIKEKTLTLRLSVKLYQQYVEKALKKGQKEKRIVKVSEVIREALEKEK